MINIEYYKTPYGELIIGDFQDKLCLCDWRYRKMRSKIDQRITTFLKSKYIEKNTPLIEDVKTQLCEYFQRKRTSFDIPLLFAGSDFQLKVWQALQQIPYGKTISYLELSKKLGNEKAIRAVAAANGANAISIIVPCHRVIGSKGELTGYAGGLPVKKRLLLLENRKPVYLPDKAIFFFSTISLTADLIFCTLK